MEDDILDSEHSSIGSDPGVSLADFEITSQDKNDRDYEMLTSDQLIGLMYEIIRSVSPIIHLPDTILRLLLAHYQWDKDVLSESYFELDEKCLFEKAKINLINFSRSSTPNDKQVAQLVSKMSSNSPVVETVVEENCEICCIVVDGNDQLGLGCGHFFCLACWKNYLKWKIIEDNQIDRILCPAYGCEYIVKDSIVFELISDDDFMKKRFQKLITNSFVQHNRTLTWCPGVDCVYASRSLVGVYEPKQIVCESCSEAFCFSCGNPWHEPVQCREMSKWSHKVTQDAGTFNWIVANTKECPKCKIMIEKAGGCNHMICFNTHCKYEFCWVCLGKWEPHGSEWYSCNRYDKEEAQNSRNQLNESRAELNRYLFYVNRYSNHFQSLKFENKLNESVQQKIKAMQTDGISYIDVKFITNVVDVLCKCRRTLMYTYVFAYYIKMSNQSIIFEGNQSDLERATECLSGLLERDLNTTSMTEIKQKIQDKAAYCENRRQVLLNHVAEGNDAGTWKYLN